MTWNSGEPLPNAQNVEIDPRKFEEYSMNPDNPANQEKWMAFEAVGYAVWDSSSRSLAARDVIRQLKQQLASTPASQGRNSIYGLRFEVQIAIQGPNGRQGSLQTVWQIDNGVEVPKLITNWLEVYQ